MCPMLDIQKKHAEVYRIRFGDRNGNAPRKLTDAIRVTSPSEAVVAAFVAVYGGEVKPWKNESKGAQFEAYLPTTELSVMVLPGQSVSQWWEKWRGSVCERRCDSEIETLSGNGCLCAAVDGGDPTVRIQNANLCRPTTRVAVLCPDVEVVGAGSFVSHGMVAAETLPQAISIAEAALARGLMVPAVLRIVEHKGRKHFIVPQIEIVGVSLNQLATGQIPDALVAGATAGLETPDEQPALPPAPVKKAAPKKAAAKKAVAPREPATPPPLPGDTPSAPPKGAVTEANRRGLADRIGALDVGLKALLMDEWRTAHLGSVREGSEQPLLASQMDEALVLVATYEDYAHNRRSANAAMGEAGLTEDDERHALVAFATNGDTASTKALTPEQTAAVRAAAERLGKGELQLAFHDDGSCIVREAVSP